MKQLNWFNHKSGKKLTKTQEWIIRNIEWKINTYGFLVIPLCIVVGIIYVMLHFVIKYW